MLVRTHSIICLALGLGACGRLPEAPSPTRVAINVAAHPDDEDGATMHYLRHARDAAVYSVIFTRGEGGQNEIGSELYEALGAIRSAETEAAARALGTQVFFLNFNDFGYSKTAAEAFEHWGGRDHVTAELVYLFRRLRPDVVFTNHDTVTTGPRRQHGHHQAVGLAAYDAFGLAADSTYHPAQLLEPGVELWQPERLFLRHFAGGASSAATLPVGDINPSTGSSYAEGAAGALAYHASQGMDLFAERVRALDSMRFSLLRSKSSATLPLEDLFAGLPQRLEREFELAYAIDSGRIAPIGFSIDDSVAVPGQEVALWWDSVPRGRMRWEFSGAIDTTVRLMEQGMRLQVPRTAAPTRPAAVYQYDRRKNHPPVIYAAYREGEEQPAIAGYLPLEIAPPLHLEASEPVIRLKPGLNALPLVVHVFDPALRSTSLSVTVTGGGTVVLEHSHAIEVKGPGILRDTVELPMPGMLPDADLVVTLSALQSQVNMLGRVFDVSAAAGLRVGLVRSYDNSLERALQQLGVTYVMLDSLELARGLADDIHTVVLDIRSYLVRQDLRRHNDALLDWVRRGGHLVVNYHKTFEWNDAQWPPYPLVLGRDRVTLEGAPVSVLNPHHALMTWPNNIRADAWEGWVQERGLYFPASWDARYQEMFCLNDPGEAPHCGSTLLASFGSGTYLYTALAWYRQLKTYHPGAFAVFANMISLPVYAGAPEL